jgi:hypothetical protein
MIETAEIPTRWFSCTVGLWMAPCHISGGMADRTLFVTEKTNGGRDRTRTCDLLRVKHYVIFPFIDCTGTYKHVFDVSIA